MRILLSMTIYSSSQLWTLGTGILSCICKHLKVPTHLSWDERRRLRHIAKNYLIVDDTLYRHGVDFILRGCLTHDEVEVVLNDCHGGACVFHLTGLSTSQKILRAGYFWPYIFKD